MNFIFGEGRLLSGSEGCMVFHITVLYWIRECCFGLQSWEWSTAPHHSICCLCWRVTAANRTLTVLTAWRKPGRYSSRHTNTHKRTKEWLCGAVYLDLVNCCLHGKFHTIFSHFLLQNKFSDYEKRKVTVSRDTITVGFSLLHTLYIQFR